MSTHVRSALDPDVFASFCELFSGGDPLSRTKGISVVDLKPGMTLAKPILTVEQSAIIVAHSELTSTLITHAQRFLQNNRLNPPKATIYKENS